MSFKERFKQGNNFILSPNGKVGRVRYAIYALLLDLGYRLSFGLGILSILVSMYFALFYIVGLFFIILKFFNYTKRANAIFDDKKWGYIYSSVYVATGGYIANYLAIKQLMTENIQGIADWYIPPYYETTFCQVSFLVALLIEIVMFFVLVFCPAKKSSACDFVDEQQSI